MEMVAGMGPEVGIASLTFKSMRDYSSLASVQCTLTDGKASPTFEPSGGSFGNLSKLKFESSSQIRSVEACDFSD